MYTLLRRYLRVLPILHRADVVGIFFFVVALLRYSNFTHVEKHAMCQRDYRLQSLLCIQYVQGDLCKHLGIDSSTDRIPISRIGTRIYS